MSDEVKNDFLRRWEIDNTKYSTKSNADKTKLKMELKTLDEKQMNLLDAYLDHTITNEEYTAVKQKIINRLQKIGSDFRLAGQKVCWLWENPWRIITEKTEFLESSGIRESDPHLSLGKATYYHCTNPASKRGF